MTFAENLARAAATATCSWFNTGGNTALSTVLVNGVITTGLNPATITTGLGLLALSYGCSYDPNNPGALPPAPPLTGCVKTSSGTFGLYKFNTSGSNIGPVLLSLSQVSKWQWFQNSGGNDFYDYAVVMNGTPQTGSLAFPTGTTFKTILDGGAVCAETVQAPGPTGHLDPVTHHDTVGGCDIKVEHLAWNLLPDGRMQPVLKMTPVPKTRASGGVISGCNFDPVIYVGPPAGGPPGGGGGGGIIPWLPPSGAGPNWWIDAIQGVLEGTLEAALEKLFETKFQPDTYRLVSVCETDDQGEPVSQERRVDIPALPGFEAVVARVDALTQLIQGVKDFKQPVCEAVVPSSTGRSISVNFVSTEDSPQGLKPLYKAFRYRDQTATELVDHRDHWDGFTWKSGPWMVMSDGLPWGKPQVWAATSEEGKRVIRHAAAIAGVDLDDPKHRWVMREVHNHRYGEVLDMVVRRDKQGALWVSERSGPSGLPQVVV